MRYFSTFSGIGGFELGIQNAYRAKIRGSQKDTPRDDETGKGLVTTQGKDTSTKRGRTGSSIADILNERPLCVGYSEIDKWASSVYEYHFKGTKNYGDITKINAEELPDFDCLVGGFPCQAFSIAGKRKGFGDTRGTLFFDLARILQAKQPRLFVFENVKGLLSHDGGQTFATIIATITELGYDCQWQVLNSKNHGVPQNRERVIIVGHLRGTPRPEVFPIAGTNQKNIVQLNNPTHSNDRVYATEGIGPTLNTMQGGLRQPFIGELGATIRRLTPKECELLQGFPAGWTENGVTYYDGGGMFDKRTSRYISSRRFKISASQRYKMCGNAVTTNVIQAVFERIFDTQKDD